MKNKFYVYAYLDPIKPGKYSYDGLDVCFLYEPFYIGKGSGNRITNHLKKSLLKENTPKNNKIKEILNLKYNPITIKIGSDMSEEESLSLEIKTINGIGLENLKNLTHGGEGLSGYNHKQETKDKIKNSLIGKNLGRKLSDEWKLKIKENNSKYWLGKKHSEETKMKLSKKNKGREFPERRNSYKITSPIGEVFLTDNLSKFCKKNDLQRTKMISVSTGNRNHHKKWKCDKISN
jgi:hypothetical protein